MRGLMQDRPLLVSGLLDHAERNHAGREIVTALVEGGLAHSNYGECALRARKVAQALQRLGIKIGDRVGTLAWNTQRHVELWYGISGMGAVTHTINPRLFKEQIVYIINHAEDRILAFDLTFLPLIEALAPQLKSIEHHMLMSDAKHMPAKSSLKNLLCYEEIVEREDGDFSWPMMDENTAAGLCYTSGTTGKPKGVLYSHRSNVLHTMAACMTDTLGMSATDCVLPIVPMFHANAWGIPYCTTSTGAKLVLNGPNFDAPTLQKLIIDEGVTCTAAVPTVWLGMLNHLDATGGNLGPLKNVLIGGAAAPRSMIQAFQDRYGVTVNHAWGMTETSPLGTVGSPTSVTTEKKGEARLDWQVKQGRGIFGIEMKIVDGDGREQPRDGKAFGHLLVRGPWVAKQYFKGDGGDILDEDGWFDTGDVATIDAHGYMQITDRSKDVIKSGGEWISSIEIENLTVGHPRVAEAAVIGIRHPKWDERPLLIVVPKHQGEGGNGLSKDEILEYLKPKIAKWWLPDDVVFADELPHTATGKIQKLELRKIYKDYKLPGV